MRAKPNSGFFNVDYCLSNQITDLNFILEELEKRGSGGGATTEPLQMIKTTIEFDS